MRELTERLRGWRLAGIPFALATVVGVRGSAPRQPGAVMAVNVAGEVVGSVSGGCVEGAVYEVAAEVLATGTPKLETYGISDGDAFAVGLTCGGVIDVLVAPPDQALLAALDALDAGEPVALVSVLHCLAAGPGDAAGDAPGDAVRVGCRVAVWEDRVVGGLGSPGLDRAALDDARGLLAAGQSGVRHYGPRGERSPVDAAAAGSAADARVPGADEVAVFVQVFAPPPRMLVFGAIDYADALVSMGRFLGYRVTVCDARPVFATARRFPAANEVVCEWPARYLARARVDRRTVICVLTHDPRFDVPLLRLALRSPAAYVGAMGSRHTHEERLSRLREDGLTETELARLRSPIGLDLGGRTPAETAVAIAAEIIQAAWGGSGAPLGHTEGRIHAATGGCAE